MLLLLALLPFIDVFCDFLVDSRHEIAFRGALGRGAGELLLRKLRPAAADGHETAPRALDGLKSARQRLLYCWCGLEMELDNSPETLEVNGISKDFACERSCLRDIEERLGSSKV